MDDNRDYQIRDGNVVDLATQEPKEGYQLVLD